MFSNMKYSLFSPRSPLRPFSSSTPPSSATKASQKIHSYPRTTQCAKSSTLHDMISQEDLRNPSQTVAASESRRRLQERIASTAADAGALWGQADVEVSVSSPDGSRISFLAHRQVLAHRSRFFEANLGRGATAAPGSRVAVEICDCDDVEVYAEVVAMMYVSDLKGRLAGEGVARVLEFLKVSAAIMFDDGVVSCVEFLDAAPWSEEEERKVASAIGELRLHEPLASPLQRLYLEPSADPSVSANTFIHKLLTGVLHAKDEKARREVKALLCRLLGEVDIDQVKFSRETLHNLCTQCLGSLSACLMDASSNGRSGEEGMGKVSMGVIAREADNLQWLAEILISKKMGAEFVALWANQSELARLHALIPKMYRYEISRITAQLCVALGMGEILVSLEVRSALLNTWLEALYEDFGWMRRACRSFNKKMVEEALCQTILTLPMIQQQAFLLRWFDRFLNRGDDCPNLQRAFQVWWRRVFIRNYMVADHKNCPT